MSRLPVLVTLILLIAASPGAQSGDIFVPSDRVVDSVGVRKEASADAEIVGRLRKGAEAALLLDVPRLYFVRLTVLKKYISERAIIDGPIELLVVTHGDTDHWKGLERLMNFDGKAPGPPKVLEFWEPGYDRDCNGPSNPGRKGYLSLIDAFRKVPGPRFVRPLQDTHPPADQTGRIETLTLPSVPSVRFTVLHAAASPVSDNTECSYLINNASIVLRIEIGTTSLLFTSDANGKECDETDATRTGHVERGLLQLEAKSPGLLEVDVLKVPHHGSETASTVPFIEKTNPHYAIISASTTHHLPKDAVIHRYESPDRVILRTDGNHASNQDHVVCFKNVGQDIDCNFEAVLAEGGVIQ